MKTAIIKPILVGVLLGAALFAAPFFLLRLLLAALVIGAVVRLWSGRSRRRYGRSFHPAWADRIRNMSDAEYTAFRQQGPPRRPWPNDSAEPPASEIN